MPTAPGTAPGPEFTAASVGHCLQARIVTGSVAGVGDGFGDGFGDGVGDGVGGGGW